MRRTIRENLLVVALLGLVALCGSGLQARAAEGAEGFWSGTIQVPNREIEVQVDVSRTGGDWSAAVYVPAQGIRGVAMIGVEIEGRSVAFGIPEIPGDPTFRGQLTEDGASIEGEFTQGGATLPFRLERAEKPAELTGDIYAEYVRPGTAGEGLAGTWLAMIESGPHRYRMVFRLTRDPEGGYSGAIDSLDQGAMDLTIDDVQAEAGRVKLDLYDINAIFEGSMAEDGSEIPGTWRQMGQEMPLTLRRKAG